MIIRCPWVGTGKPYYEKYHDEEWGIAIHDDQKHFEMLSLEGAQAGLSWETILKKRDAYREAFKGFDPKLIAEMSDEELEELMHNDGIIRNRLKIFSVRRNAIIFLNIQREFSRFDSYVWSFVNGAPILNNWHDISEVPCFSKEGDCLSKDLKKRGMTFVGPKIIYSYMQAVGMVNDHIIYCWKHHSK